MTASTDRQPILVTGVHRSGSTWVADVLAAAPSLGYIREPFHPGCRRGIFRVGPKQWYPFVDERLAPEYRRAYRDMLGFRYRIASELPTLRSPRDVGRMGRDVARFSKYRLLRKRPFVKDPFSLFSTEWLAKEFGMKVVMLVRHPAAFVSSCARLEWDFSFRALLSQPALVEALLTPYVDDMERADREGHDLVRRTALFWRISHGVMHRFLGEHPDWHMVRHEDLSAAPVDGFRALFEYLHVDFTPGVRSRVLRLSGADKPAEAKAGATHSLERDSRANIKNWKSRLSDEDVRVIRETTEDVAANFYGDDAW